MSVLSMKEARVEIERCVRHVADGGDIAFWIRRLEAAKKEHEGVVALLRAQLDALAVLERNERRKEDEP